MEDERRNCAVNESWKKVKRMCLNSVDTAFTRHKHDKCSLQTKAQKPGNEEISKGKWNSKLAQGKFFSRDSTTISIG